MARYPRRKRRQTKAKPLTRLTVDSAALQEESSRLVNALNSSERERSLLHQKHTAAQHVIRPLFARIATNMARMESISRDPANQIHGLLSWISWIGPSQTETATRQCKQLDDECLTLFAQISSAVGKEDTDDTFTFEYRHVPFFLAPESEANTVWATPLVAKRIECEQLKKKIDAIDRVFARQRRQVEADNRAARRAAGLELLKAKAAAGLELLKAKAASVDGTARHLADAIKRKLEAQTGCPYCGEDLGEQPHADHIYPLSKGGHSVIANMMMVCAECNVKKGAMTLRAFIIKHGLNRDEIEQRLQRLGKDF